ncbi:Cysteine-rich secretory protein family protein [compost metagenome]
MKITEDTYRSYELEILDLTNVFRVSKGVSTLTWNDQAAVAARLHSADMAAQNYFEHNNLEGKTPGDRMAAQGLISFKAWGENIAAGHTNAIDAHYGWINSLGHRVNLLRGEYTWLGVGVKRAEENSKYGIYYTQNFYTPL